MRDLSDSAHGGPRDWVSHYDIIAFVCTITSRRVRCECTVQSFTTLGECGLSLSLGHDYHADLELRDRSRG